MSKPSKGNWLSVGLLLALASCTSAFAASVTYTYDNLNRLTGMDYGNGFTISYTYDAAGNRLARYVVLDTDSDGTPDDLDPDDDNEGVIDEIENYYGSDPLNPDDKPQPFTDVLANGSYYLPTLLLDYHGIAENCASGTFCPDQVIKRDTAAIWLVKAFEGGTYIPGSATGLVFADIATDTFAADFIESLSLHGGTEGCDAASPLPNYCPGQPLSKAQAAKMLLMTKYGAGYSPTPAGGLVHDDVATGTFAADFIEALQAEGAAEGCSVSPPLYCPQEMLTRGGFAKMLAKTFGLAP